MNIENHKLSRRDALKVMGSGALLPLIPGCAPSQKNGLQPALADPIYYSSVRALAQAIRAKDVSSEEVVRACLDRIEEVNPALNAVVQLDREGALEKAKEADAALSRGEHWGPLHGVPMTIKDSFDTAGMISTGGTKGRTNYLPDEDATVVARLKGAGAILMGKTNTPELTLWGTTENLVYGRTNNPYDLSRTPSGSSGGAAAIVSAGGSPFDIGTDTGGSIRNPSNFCGLCGLKPSSGRVSRQGHIVSWHYYDQALTTAGPMTRSVDDLSLIFSIIAGPDGIDPYIYDLPLGDPESVNLIDLRVAFYLDNGIHTSHGETRLAVQSAVNNISSLTARIKQTRADAVTESMEVWRKLGAVDQGYGYKKIVEEAGTQEVWLRQAWGRKSLEEIDATGLSPKEITDAFETLARFRSEMTSHYSEYDIILVPFYSPAPSHESPEVGQALSYTCTYNLVGWPVAVVRVGTSSEGLPLGVQIVGKPWQEQNVLAVAKFLETALGGFQPPSMG